MARPAVFVDSAKGKWAMADEQEYQQEAISRLLWGTLVFLVISDMVLGGLAGLFFYVGGGFLVGAWIIVGFTVIWTWRGLRQVVKLSQGDLTI